MLQLTRFTPLLLALSVLLASPARSQPSGTELFSQDTQLISDRKIAALLSDREPHDALRYYQKVHEKLSAENDSMGMARIEVEMGQVNYEIGNYGDALKHHTAALSIFREMGNDSLTADQLSRIGSVYYFSEQLELDKALRYYQDAYVMFSDLGMQSAAALNLNFSAYVEWARGNKGKCLSIHKDALGIFQELNDKKGIATALSDIGFTLNSMGLFEEALQFHFKALDLEKELGEDEMQIPTLNNIGISYQQLGKLNRSLEYSQKSLKMAQERNHTKRMLEASRTLTETYSMLGRHDSALAMHQKFKAYSDSLLNLKQVKRLAQQSLRSEMENEKAAMRLEEEKRKMLHHAELDKQRVVRNGLIIIIVLIVILVVILYQNYREKNRSHEELSRMNAIILQQKYEVENKNKDITDSVRYAKRLQNTILPTESELKRQLQDVFVLFEPKDIVSGDFYWLESVGGCTYVAVADCTGHGIPGALVSMVCHGALTRAVHEFELRRPNEILDKCRDMVSRTFNGGDHQMQDGMDIALCCIDRSNGKLHFSGANNPIYRVPAGSIKAGKPTIETLPADRQPVANYLKEEPFSQVTIEPAKGDLFYLFSDGFADQFGGDKNQKFKYRRFRKLIKEVSHYPMAEQKKYVSGSFTNWKRHFDQIDDVCILCFRF